LNALKKNVQYEVTLGVKGLVFSHNFHHASKACDDQIEIAYTRLLPFLTIEGKKEVGLLMKSAA
jgi:hypothetical protein